MKKNWKAVFAAAALLGVICAGAAAAAGSAGSQDDPLVTLSYLNDVFAPSLNAAVDRAVKANEDALRASLNAAIDQWTAQLSGQPGGGSPGEGGAVFHVVTLSNGQTLTGEVGCEVMLRVGTAACVSSGSPGLIDMTGGSVLENGGALVKNHLYMITVETRDVKATAATVKVLVRGSYTVSQ